MLSRCAFSALLAGFLLSSVASAATIMPVDVSNPTFRLVKTFWDLTSRSNITAPPFVPPNAPVGTIGGGLATEQTAGVGNCPTTGLFDSKGDEYGCSGSNDVDDLSVHGLTHPGSTTDLRDTNSTTNGANQTNVLTLAGGGAFSYQALPAVGPLGAVSQIGLTAASGMVDLGAAGIPAYAFGGSSPDPDPLDSFIFNFLTPGVAIEGILNSDNNPDGVGPGGFEGPDGLIALPGTFTASVFTIDISGGTDADGGFPVVSGTLTGDIYSTGLNSPPIFDPNGVPIPGGPNGVLPFKFLDSGALDPNGVAIGDPGIGLTSTKLSGMNGVTVTADLAIWCETVNNPSGVCQFQYGHGYLASSIVDPNAPITGVAQTLGLSGAWGLTTSTGGGGVPVAPGARAVPIGVFNAVGAVDLGGRKFVLMSTSGDLGFAEIPEPGTLVLLGAALAGLAALRRRTTS
jgi:hypothetical protein